MANSKLKRARTQTNQLPQKQASNGLQKQEDQSTPNIMEYYLNSYLAGTEMTSMQLENVALILKHSPAENVNKETFLRILERLCSDPKDLLESAQRLQMFNVFLMRVEFGLPLPVEYAIGALFQNPQVVNKRLSAEVQLELDVCRRLCEKLLACRTIKLNDEQLVDDEPTSSNMVNEEPANVVNEPVVIKERSETPPICITLEDDSQECVLTVEENENARGKVGVPGDEMIVIDNVDCDKHIEVIMEEEVENAQIAVENDNKSSDSDIIIEEENVNKTAEVVNEENRENSNIGNDNNSSDSDIIIEEAPTTSSKDMPAKKTTSHEVDLIVQNQKERDSEKSKDMADLDLVNLF